MQKRMPTGGMWLTTDLYQKSAKQIFHPNSESRSWQQNPLGRLSCVSIRRWMERAGPIHHPPEKGVVPYVELKPSLRSPLLLRAMIPTQLTGSSTASNFSRSKRLEPKTLFSDDGGCFFLKGSLGKPPMGWSHRSWKAVHDERGICRCSIQTLRRFRNLYNMLVGLRVCLPPHFKFSTDP